MCILLDDTTSTMYRNRGTTYWRVAEDIAEVVMSRTGNYIVYFPSYEYLQNVHELYRSIHPEAAVAVQHAGMLEREREEFLALFSPDAQTTLVGFAVMGGIFGEGIDLVGERLCGVIIVGVGLPQISIEREIIREYFDDIREAGFQFAYVYPGMNKVLQAAGRLIRTETDRGVILLIDDRFATPLYESLYPPEWLPIPQTSRSLSLSKTVQSFWTGDREPAS